MPASCFQVFSFGIEYHHIHHFDIRVPGYRLERCDAEGEVACMNQIIQQPSHLEEAFTSIRHVLACPAQTCTLRKTVFRSDWVSNG